MASPDDVQAERQAAEEVITELNKTWGRTLGARLEPIRFETDGYPDFGSDPQAVVNQQLGEDYDIFLGILWKRFGTPTPRAESGTEEEFTRAYDRFTSQQGVHGIMIYFKTESVPVDVDTEQLNRVRRFQQRLGALGGVYWCFAETAEFKDQLRVHLGRIVQKVLNEIGATTRNESNVLVEPGPASATLVIDVPELTEEEGFLDLIERGTESMSLSTAATLQLSAIIEEYGDEAKRVTNELSALEGSDPAAVVSGGKQVINRLADKMEFLAERMRTETHAFGLAYSTALTSYGKAASLLGDFGAGQQEQLNNTITSIRTMKAALKTSLETQSSLRASLRKLPRATTRFNAAKRETLRALEALDEELRKAFQLTSDVEKLLEGLIAT